MPKMGVEMQTGILLEWLVDEGESVDEGDVIAEIESEKTNAEVTARESGVLRRTLLKEGNEVAPGTAMGIVAAADVDIDELLSTVETEEVEVDTDVDNESTGEGQSALADAGTGSSAGDQPSDKGTSVRVESQSTSGSVRATPKARQQAAKEGINLGSVRGTGPKGAVTVEDISARGTDQIPKQATNATTTVETDRGELLVTPRAQKRASELDVPLKRIEGTGPHGSIRAADVDVASEASSRASPATPTGDAAGVDATGTVVEEQALTGMRSTIARRLSESWEAPHVTIDRRIDAEAIFNAADAANEVVSITDILLKAVSEALARHPTINSTYKDGIHRVYEEHNIGFAVDVDQGLVTPVLQDVEPRSVTEIAHERGALTDRVQNRHHESSDLQGGTFTISNLGVFGIDSFTPIINPPQVAILGVNTVREEPQRTERGIEFRRMIGFSLSFDHRIIDGADAARFLDTLATTLEAADELIDTSRPKSR